MIEKNDLYDYGLYIYQNPSYFKFSIDSILLGEIVDLHNNDRILDMCTGNCPIPLILSTKNKNLNIDAVEIQKEVYELAKRSVTDNNLDSNINVYNQDIKLFDQGVKYDIITCNPPYFKADANLKNNNEIKKVARHEVSLKLDETIKTASRLIKDTGTFYMVHRTDRLLDSIELLKKNKFKIRKIVFIETRKDKPCELFIVESCKNKKNDAKILIKQVYDLTTFKDIFKG